MDSPDLDLISLFHQRSHMCFLLEMITLIRNLVLYKVNTHPVLSSSLYILYLFSKLGRLREVLIMDVLIVIFNQCVYDSCSYYQKAQVRAAEVPAIYSSSTNDFPYSIASSSRLIWHKEIAKISK